MKLLLTNAPLQWSSSYNTQMLIEVWGEGSSWEELEAALRAFPEAAMVRACWAGQPEVHPVHRGAAVRPGVVQKW